jgi:hypothetical protein
MHFILSALPLNASLGGSKLFMLLAGILKNIVTIMIKITIII